MSSFVVALRRRSPSRWRTWAARGRPVSDEVSGVVLDVDMFAGVDDLCWGSMTVQADSATYTVVLPPHVFRRASNACVPGARIVVQGHVDARQVTAARIIELFDWGYGSVAT